MDHVCSGLWYIWVWILGVLGFGFGYLGVSLMINNKPICHGSGLCYFYVWGGFRF